MSIIIPANSAVSGGFEASNSLMFNRADSAYLVHTNSGTGDYQQSTFSAWVKRSSLGTIQTMWNNQIQAGVNQVRFEFDAADKIYIYGEEGGGYALRALTTSVYRDLSAWYHVLVIIDTPQSAAADRIKLYVNGVQVTLTFSTTPAQNANLRINYDNTPVSVGSTQASNYLDGYMAEVYWIDGTVYATSDFGEFDEDSGIWKPIDASGLTFGTNGFYLDFENSSALGDDAAGSNDFSLNNIATTDQGIDTCTNNFATLNPLNAFYTNSTFTDGNTTFASGSSYTGTKANILLNTGKWYWEVKVISKTGDSDNYTIGIQGQESTATNQFPGLPATGYAIYGVNGQIYNNNSGSTYAAAYAAGNIIGVALDLTNSKLYFSKDGAWSTGSGAWDSSTFDADVGDKDITAPASTPLGGYYPSQTFWSGSGATFSMNFGSPYFAISSGNADGDGFGNFEYAVPSGYFALCTKNLAEYG